MRWRADYNVADTPACIEYKGVFADNAFEIEISRTEQALFLGRRKDYFDITMRDAVFTQQGNNLEDLGECALVVGPQHSIAGRFDAIIFYRECDSVCGFNGVHMGAQHKRQRCPVSLEDSYKVKGFAVVLKTDVATGLGETLRQKMAYLLLVE
jgi:hypothetical protein